MAIFDYRCFNANGKTVKGIIDAPSIVGAQEKLKNRGLYLREITEIKKSGKSIFQTFSLTKKSTVTSLITRQLSFLLGGHLPVVNALEGVIDQLEDEATKKMMIDIKDKIKEGKSVSQAFSDYPQYFSNMYVNTLHAGEVSGKLDQVFKRLSDMYEKNQVLISKLRSALTYPGFLLLFSLLIIVFLVSFIVPTFAKLFEDFGQVLPLPTRILIGTSGIISSGWWAILLFAGGLFLLFRRIYRGEKGKLYFDRLVLKLPFVKKLILDTFKIRFSYTMSLMLSNGVGIIEALENTGGIFKNRLFTDIISRAVGMVKKGEPLSRALASNPVFNSPLLGMIHAGEMSDRVPEVLDSIAHNIEVDLEEKVGTLTALAEPVLILIIGVILGFTVLSIMLPIFQINQIF